MKDKIQYIIENEQFPLGKSEQFVLSMIAIAEIAIFIVLVRNQLDISFLIGIAIALLLLFFMIYRGLTNSLKFSKIITNYSTNKNIKIIKMCLLHLNINAFKDTHHENVFVCFIHKRGSSDREEIYIIAKDNAVLINSNKDKNIEDERIRMDMMERIGLSIFITAKRLHELDSLN